MLRIPRKGLANAIKSILPTVLAVMNVKMPPGIQSTIKDIDKCRFVGIQLQMTDKSKRNFAFELV